MFAEDNKEEVGKRVRDKERGGFACISNNRAREEQCRNEANVLGKFR